MGITMAHLMLMELLSLASRFQKLVVKMFQGKSAGMYQEKNATTCPRRNANNYQSRLQSKCPNKNAQRFQDKNATKFQNRCPDSNVIRFQSKNVIRFQEKCVTMSQNKSALKYPSRFLRE